MVQHLPYCRQKSISVSSSRSSSISGIPDPSRRPSLISRKDSWDVSPLPGFQECVTIMSSSWNLNYKVMLVGDSGAGKSSVLIRFRDDKFHDGSYISTIGIDFRNKIVDVDDTKVKLQIWDTAGQERFRSVTHAYYRDAHALLLLYDITNRGSFDNTRAWLAEIKEYAQTDVIIMLLGNKCDVAPAERKVRREDGERLAREFTKRRPKQASMWISHSTPSPGNKCDVAPAERKVRREDGERLAREFTVPFLETSAKTGLNVDLAFNAIARALKHKQTSSPEMGTFSVKAFVDSQVEKSPSRCSCG
ncbi:unnamed protein product [Cyprideis torosa]|uniref:small monomeric GTPase n=1 Tax=Cyprideis torosa TaxID=163714 RepID=A0A7R8W259_9CRUS|nr:unnamed protein product [Cyprideis torosa]CAG0881599.1 unnamed protein product [Cyprideis torosa]